MNPEFEFAQQGYVGSFKSEHYIHLMELPVNSLICNRWLMQAYDPIANRYGSRHKINHVTLEELGKRNDQIAFTLEQRCKIPALYGYNMHLLSTRR